MMRSGDQKNKLEICCQLLSPSTELQKRSLHPVDWTKTAAKYTEMKNAQSTRAKRAKLLFFIAKDAISLLSSWLLKKKDMKNRCAAHYLSES